MTFPPAWSTVTLVLYGIAAAFQIGGLVRAWVKTTRAIARETEIIERIPELFEQQRVRFDERVQNLKAQGIANQDAEFQKAMEELEQQRVAELTAAGWIPVTWQFHDTIANQVTRHVLIGAKESYKLEGVFIIVGILIATLASAMSILLPMT